MDDGKAEADLARQAYSLFSQRQPAKSLQILHRLAKQNKDDPRILQNTAVVLFHKEGCQQPKKLQESLTKVEAAITNKLANCEALLDSGKTIPLNSSFVVYNQAILAFDLQQYQSCINILEPLYLQLEFVDDQFATNVCFLLLDTYLECNFTKKAHRVIDTIEKLYPCLFTILSHAQDQDHDQQQQQQQRQQQHKGGVGSNLPYSNFTASEFKNILHIYKAKVYLLSGSVKESKRELKCAMGAGQSPSSIFLKSNLEYLRCNYRKSVKLLNAYRYRLNSNGTLSPDVADSALPALYYNNLGCVFTRRGRLHAASHYFVKALQHVDDVYRTRAASGDKARVVTTNAFGRDRQPTIMYNYGLVLLHSGSNQARLAFSCFLRASQLYHHHPPLWLRLAECCIACHVGKLRDEGRDLASPDADSGVFADLTTGSGSLERILLPTAATTGNDVELLLDPTLKGKHKQQPNLLFARACLRNALYLIKRSYGEQPSQAPSESPTPDTAANDSTKNATSAPAEVASADVMSLLCTPVDELYSSCLLALAFVGLCTRDPLLTVQCTAELLASESANENEEQPIPSAADPPAADASHMIGPAVISPSHAFLGHIYSAEALCLLGRPNEALEHLSPSFFEKSANEAAEMSAKEAHLADGATDTPYPLPSPNTHPEVASPCNKLGASSRTLFFINLSTVYSLSEDADRALQALATAVGAAEELSPVVIASKLAPESPYSAHVRFAAAHLLLRKGDTGSALQCMTEGRMCSRVNNHL